jgi:hypothetical protein
LDEVYYGEWSNLLVPPFDWMLCEIQTTYVAAIKTARVFSSVAENAQPCAKEPVLVYE